MATPNRDWPCVQWASSDRPIWPIVRSRRSGRRVKIDGARRRGLSARTASQRGRLERRGTGVELKKKLLGLRAGESLRVPGEAPVAYFSHRAGTRVRGSPSGTPQSRQLGRRTRRVVRGGCWGHAPRWPARNRGHGVAARARMRASHWSIRTELMLHSTRRRRSSSERQPLALSWSWSATPGA